MIKKNSSKLFIFILVLSCLLFSFLVKAQKIDYLHYSQELIRKNKIDSALIILKKEITRTKVEKEKGFIFLELGNAYKLQQDYEK